MSEQIEALPCVSEDPTIQARYVELRAQGEGHYMAEMFAFRQPPGTKDTDRAFFQNKMNGEELKALPPGMSKRAAANYKRQTGREIPQSGVYISQLAERPCDAKAYFDNLGDLKRALREKGAGCEALGIEPVDVGPPKKKIAYNPRLLQRRLRAQLMQPENREKARDPKKIRKLAENIAGKHTYRPED